MKLDRKLCILLLFLIFCFLPLSFGHDEVTQLQGTRITSIGSTFTDGSSIDYITGYHCFKEGKGDQVEYVSVVVPDKRVLDFQVVLTGFNWWYPGNIDHHVHSARIDVWPWYENNEYGAGGPITVYAGGIAGTHWQNSELYLKFEESLTDSDNSDTHQCCAGVLIIAHTRPHEGLPTP